MNKKLDIIYLTMIIVPFVIIIIGLFCIDGVIPVHYGVDNEVTRWGSRFELLLDPVITTIFGGGMWVLSRKKVQTKNMNNSVMGTLMLCIGSVLIFDTLSMFFLYCAFYKITNLLYVPFAVYTFLAVGYVIFFILAMLLLKKK